MASEDTVHELIGEKIRHLFKDAEEVAMLHACLTSPRGDNFRLHLLQAMEAPLDSGAVERLRTEAQVNESHRHMHMLLSFGLAEAQGTNGDTLYARTTLGEQAINAIRELERRMDKEAAKAIYAAALGANSIRFFLRIYGDQREVNWEHLQIRYTPMEIGKLSLFLPRIIEGISAVDKLNEAGLLVYREDNYIYMQAVKARSFYQYLQQLHQLLKAGLRDHRNK